MEQKVIYCDGSATWNNTKDQSKRKMAICYVDDQIPNHFQIKVALPVIYGSTSKSNNLAELLGLLDVIKYAVCMFYKNLEIRLDSRTIIWWVRKPVGKISKKITDPELVKKLLQRFHKVEPWFDKLELKWVPRDQNKAGIILERRIGDIEL